MEKVEVRAGPGELQQKKEQRGIKRKVTRPLANSSKKSSGLRRWKSPLSFQVSSADQKDHSRSASVSSLSAATNTALVGALAKRIYLLDLIVRRNKNQHCNQLFFKHLCMLRAALNKLLDVSVQLDDLSRVTISGRSSELIRRNFEAEAGLRSRKEVLEEHVKEILVPKCYLIFSGLVGDSQFGNLGVVLVALLSEVAFGKEGVGSARVIQDDKDHDIVRIHVANESGRDAATHSPRSLIVTSTKATGEDQGEIVERVYDYGGESEGEDEARSEGGSHADQVMNEKTQKDNPQLDKIPSDDKKAFETQLPIQKVAYQSVSVDNTFDKAINTGKLGRKRFHKDESKKSNNAIDDLFSGLL